MQDKYTKKFSNILQIDIIKGLAIISVILLHTIPENILIKTFSVFYIWQAVPIFLIIMGITLNISLSRKVHTNILQIYKQYILSRVKRLIPPFAIIFLISLCWGIYHNNFYIGWFSLIGLLPVSGHGNYFISLLFQFMFVAPLIFLVYKKSPKLMLIIMFSIDILFQLIAPHISIFKVYPYLYSACILRYFSAIALGLYVSEELLNRKYIDVMSKKNRFILVGIPISVTYLFITNLTQSFFLFSDAWRSQNVISFFIRCC